MSHTLTLELQGGRRGQLGSSSLLCAPKVGLPDSGNKQPPKGWTGAADGGRTAHTTAEDSLEAEADCLDWVCGKRSAILALCNSSRMAS